MIGAIVPPPIGPLRPVPILIFPSFVPNDFVRLPVPIFIIPVDWLVAIPRADVAAIGLIVGVFIDVVPVNTENEFEGVY